MLANGDEYVFYYKYQEGIIKIKSGTEYQISDDQAYSLNYYDGYLYYLTSDPNTISKIDINGENETEILTRTISNFELDNEKIYFTDEAGFLYSIDLNGENYSEVTEEIIGSDFQIYNKYVYYYDEDQGLMRLNMNKLTIELISDKLDSDIFNVTDEGIFFVNLENMKICKIGLKGGNYKELVDINSSNSKISVVGNKLYYIGTDEESGSYRTYRIKTNGKATDSIEY